MCKFLSNLTEDNSREKKIEITGKLDVGGMLPNDKKTVELMIHCPYETSNKNIDSFYINSGSPYIDLSIKRLHSVTRRVRRGKKYYYVVAVNIINKSDETIPTNIKIDMSMGIKFNKWQ